MNARRSHPTAAALAGLVVTALLASCRWPVRQPRTDPARLNARCMECHIDFEDEDLVVAHGKAGVSCERCHGRSQAHMEDEIRATKADVTFNGKAMALFCLSCHEPNAYRRSPSHAAELAKPDEQQKPCTACHGQHKLLVLR